MKIEIKADVDYQDNPVIFTISDEELDNDNFVELNIGADNLIVPLDDLMSALSAFDYKRKKNIERDYEKKVFWKVNKI